MANTATYNANSANSTLTTNFNVTPYYDDYNRTKEYYRLLFKPGYAVQARELTQMQTTLQNQILRFGKHVFKDGDIVLPGAYHLKSNSGDQKGFPIDYVKIKTRNAANTAEVDVTAFLGETVTGASSNIAAQITDVLDSDGTVANTKTFYVTYLGAKPGDPTIRVFQPGETLTSANAGTAVVLDSDPVANTGYASWFSIDEGVYFAKDHFITFPTQSVVLDRYNPNPTCRVGFFVNEEIINSSMDSSLLDPALESSNFSAPGADRLKLVSELAVVPFDFTDYPDFVTLFTIKNGVVQVSNEKTQYNILGDSLAKRTYDESGDYVVKGFNVQIQEHDLVTTPVNNYGRFASGDNSLLLVNIDPGYGYVKGYPVALRDKISIEISKPKNNKNVSSQIASTTMGQYVTVSELVGTWILDKGNRINFYDKPQKRITAGGGTSVTSNFKWSLGAQTGNNIGSGIINSVEYVTGTPGYDAQYNIYLSDITMTGSNTFSNVRSLYQSQSPSAIGADIYGASDASTNTALQSLNQAALLYYVGANYTKSVRAADGTGATIYYFNRTAGVDSAITTSSNGTLTLTPTLATKETIPYYGTLSDTDVSQDITMTFNESVNVGPLWSGSTVARSFAVGEEKELLGVGTKFTYLNVGDKIELSQAPANTFYVTGITSNTQMTLSAAVPGAVTASQIFKAYKTGDTLNLIGKGADNGAERTVTATSSSLAFDLKETFPQEVDTTVTYKLGLTDTSEAVKTILPNRYVKINTAGGNGPFCLGFSDVYQIRNIVLKSGSAPTNLTDGTDVTRYFSLDNGQRDTMYDLAKIVKSPALALGASDYLLVHLDYFVPSYTGRGGYFSINSYNIQDNDALSSNTTIRTENIPVYVSPVTSAKFNLRNYLDFRPVKTITAADATTPAGATTNPSNTSTTYQVLGSGLKFPVPSTELIFDYSYYIGRKDIVVIGKDGTISVTPGGASDYPLIPDASDTQMMLAILDIAPYPSLSPAYANALVRKDLSCGARKVSVRGYTMRDIGVLDKRIKNLEYYTSLTLLEKDALNLKVLDDNGNDRFKNGIFIDTFKDTSLTAKGSDPDFRIVTDPIELAIRPLFSTDSFQYNYISGDVAVNAGKITFNYDDFKFFAQTRVTDFRNLERGTYDYQGAMTLFPDQDVWIDTSYAPDEVVTTSANGATLSVSVSTSADVAAKVVKSYINTTWEDWKTQVVGFNLYRGQGAAKRFVGRFNTEEQARAAALSWTTQPDAQSLAQVGIYNAAKGDVATLETVYYNKRLGTNWFSNESTDTAIGSNKLVSSEIIPYIRPQEIVVKCQGLKPNSLVNAFFDGVNVSAYCTPLTVDQFNLAIYKKPLPINGVAAMGDDLIVDAIGNVYFIFKIVANGPKFRTGERKMIVVDGLNVSSAIDPTLDASTQATAYFFADGTKQTLQRTVYSTSGYRKTGENTSEDKNTFSDLIIPNTFVNPVPPKGHCCFDPNAKVLMANQTWKAIKDVVKGDQVIGEDEAINTVISNNKVFVGDRKMMKFKSVDGGDFYSTDDHLFLTKKGWKTWDPGYLLRNPNTRNKDFLIGENREKGIDNDDHIRKIDVVDGMLVSNFIPYADLNVTAHDFDPDYAVYDLTLDGNSTYVVEGFVVHNCCVAYTILVQAPKDEEGIFVTSYDVFIQRKSATRGLWFELREMDAAGNITDTRIPGSEVHYNNDQVNVSPDGVTNPTNVKFDAPVFLFNNKTYAFVVHSFSPAGMTIDPDTNIWIARLGEKDINTGATNIERQKMGKFFQTTNNKQWYEILDVDLTINVYRANFKTGSTSFILGNQPVEKFLLSNVSSSLSGRVGDHFITGDTLTINDANGTISTGYTLTGNTSLGAANGVVVSIPGTNKYQMSNTRYQIGEKVNMYNPDGTYAQVTANVAAISNSTAQLSYYTEQASNVYAELISSTGGFTANSIIQSVRQAGYGYRAQITDIKDYNYSVVSWEPNVLDFVKTNISYEMDSIANGSITSSGYETIYPSETHYFGEEKVIYSKTNELLNLGTDVSSKIRVTFESNSEFVSPLLDLNSSHALIIDNLINANTVGENAKSGGAALNKYISQTITLAEGQDAEDLNVYLSAYRPPGTDVKVYCKLLNATDGETLGQKSWIEMPKLGDGDITYSSISNRYNFKELSYGLPTSMMTGPNGEVQYTAGGTTFTSYKYYAVKIVLTSDSSAIVPRVADLRAIALQI